MEKKPLNFYQMASDMPPSREIKLESEKKKEGEAINLEQIQSDHPPKPHAPTDPGVTVADELNARLAMVQLRPDRAKPIKRLVKSNIPEPQHMYRYYCVCPRYHPCYVPCQHTGQIIIDRDMLKREEHICFLATPKKNFISQQRLKQPRYITKKIYVPICTARMERLAIPHPMRVKDTFKYFKHVLPPRHIAALQQQMKPKPPVEAMSMEKAMEYMEEEMRQRRAQKQQHKKRCNGLKKMILERQRKQMMKIVCVLFEEMKDFLLNDQFVIDEQSPLCAVILERIKEFTEQEFYTTSNLRDYQRILANNLTVWINKFISNLNIYLAPQQVPVARTMHADRDETFVPMSDYISLSEEMGEEMLDDLDFELTDYEDFGEEMAVPENLPSEETLIN
ncbi:uncharacterized protein LOC132793553 [Drosophila nasuta]|uniref:Uncharacterized protein LOC117567510 n=1 Tax=Drosophila albomicans TaxID=7291 RepID=A0A6P8Y3J8_DROAB|nr:uncharacterized protein LOC117567510 [Drosophila albomicans]XP_060659509.1 uncharacterized protein LOC132793553 [Drosophila nasuta]